MESHQNYYKGKRILVTGSTGFVGGWLSLTLQSFCESKVYGLGLNPITDPSFFTALNLDQILEKNYIVNILNKKDLVEVFDEVKPDIVFHLAAQPIVGISYEEPLETFDVNIMGTLNVLDCIRKQPNNPNCVIVTSDKCYQNLELGLPFKEGDPMGGFDPYSASKGACELVTESFVTSFFNSPGSSRVASARAGNIIGGGDWSQGRIVTDLVNAASNNENIELRNPAAIRPWQHVLDVVNGYLKLGQHIDNNKDAFTAYNFGPPKTHELNVLDLASSFIKFWGNQNVNVKTPDSSSLPYESKILRLDSTKAAEDLCWSTKLSQSETIQWTVDWYKFLLEHDNVEKKTHADIKNFFIL